MTQCTERPLQCNVCLVSKLLTRKTFLLHIIK